MRNNLQYQNSYFLQYQVGKFELTFLSHYSPHSHRAKLLILSNSFGHRGIMTGPPTNVNRLILSVYSYLKADLPDSGPQERISNYRLPSNSESPGRGSIQILPIMYLALSMLKQWSNRTNKRLAPPHSPVRL